MTWWQALLATVGVPGAVASAVALWLFRRAESEIDRRIDERQQHRLEHLKQQHEKELEAVRSVEQRLLVHLNAVAALHASANSAVVAKRVESADRLWKATVALREKLPTITSRVDLATEAEYPQFRQRAEVVALAKEHTYSSILSYISEGEQKVSDLRPFVGEDLWQLFSAYRGFLGRVCLLVARPEGSPLQGPDDAPWYKDDASMRLLRTSLGETDASTVERASLWKLGLAMNAFERQLLERIELMLSGEPAARKGASQLREIEQLVMEASRASRMTVR